MIRLLGAALIAACGCWIGGREAGVLRERVRVLKELADGLEGLRRELELRQTTLPELFSRLEQMVPPPVKGLFGGCAHWQQVEQDGIGTVWQEQVDRLPCLNREERYMLASLGAVLGRYPVREQGEAIGRICTYLRTRGERAEQEYGRMGKVYRGLGAASGGLLVILLL